MFWKILNKKYFSKTTDEHITFSTHSTGFRMEIGRIRNNVFTSEVLTGLCLKFIKFIFITVFRNIPIKCQTKIIVEWAGEKEETKQRHVFAAWKNRYPIKHGTWCLFRCFSLMLIAIVMCAHRGIFIQICFFLIKAIYTIQFEKCRTGKYLWNVNCVFDKIFRITLLQCISFN